MSESEKSPLLKLIDVLQGYHEAQAILNAGYLRLLRTEAGVPDEAILRMLEWAKAGVAGGEATSAETFIGVVKGLYTTSEKGAGDGE